LARVRCSSRAHSASLRRTSGVSRKAIRSDNTSSYIAASFRYTNEHRIGENIELVCEKIGHFRREISQWVGKFHGGSEKWTSRSGIFGHLLLIKPISYSLRTPFELLFLCIVWNL